MPFSFLVPVNMSGLEVRDVRAEVVGALPGMPDATQTGRYVYHSGAIKYSDGTQWVTLGAAGAGGPPSGSAGGDLAGSTYPNPTIAADAVSNTKLANMAASSIKGNNTGSAADPIDMTVAQTKTLLALTKSDVGLSNVDNTSDANAPVSTAQQTALNLKADTATDHIAGAGLTGGGTLAASRTFAVGAGTGITVNADDVAVNSAVLPLSGFAVPSADVSMNNFKITNLAQCTGPSDAAHKGYVDSLALGLSWKENVRAATTVNITLSAAQTIDGVAVVVADRVLVKNQTTPAQNGIYTVGSGAWTRTTDADSDPDLVSATVFVSEGTTQADTAWTMTTNAPITVGTTSLTWVQFGAGTTYSAGSGLTLTGNVLDVGAGSGITVAADTVAVDSAVVEVVSRKGAASGYAPLDASSKVPLANLPSLGKAFAGNVGAGTAVVINHALNTRDVNVDVYRNSTPWDTVLCDVERTDVNNVTLRFAVSVAANAYRCVVTGV